MTPRQLTNNQAIKEKENGDGRKPNESKVSDGGKAYSLTGWSYESWQIGVLVEVKEG